MATQAEYNQFRRLIGDYGTNTIPASTIDDYLNDAAAELTADFTTPVAVFDSIVSQFRPEIVVWAARNYWWNLASKYVDHHSTSMGGGASHQASEKWDRAMRMIEYLEEYFSKIQTLGTDIMLGNLSRFSKRTLTRFGGVREEDALESQTAS